jgi:arsenate reductase
MLEEKKLQFKIIEYLESGLTGEKILNLKNKLEIELIDMVRINEDEYRALSFENPSDNELVKALVEHPKLLQRPIVELGGKAIIARPAEMLEDLLREN